MKQIHFCFWKPARAFSSYCREVPSRRCFSAPSSLWFYEFSKDVVHMTEINIIWEGIYDIVSYFTTYLVRANKYLKLIIIYRKSKIIETFVCAAESYWYQGSLFEKQSKFFCQYIQQVCSTSRKNPKMIACLILHRGDAMKKLFWVMVLASEDGISRCHKNSRGVVVYDPLAMCTWNVFYRLTIINNIPLRVPATAKFINIITQYNGEIISWGKLVKTWILSSSNTD